DGWHAGAEGLVVVDAGNHERGGCPVHALVVAEGEVRAATQHINSKDSANRINIEVWVKCERLCLRVPHRRADVLPGLTPVGRAKYGRFRLAVDTVESRSGVENRASWIHAQRRLGR